MMKHFVTFIFAATAIFQFATSAEWNYISGSPNGPQDWPSIAEACGGPRQSPINIVTSTVETITGQKTLAYRNYAERPTSVKYKNSGHGYSVSMEFPTGKRPELIWGPLGSDVYVFEQFHLHWRGEHTLDGKSFPAEIHFVHYNKKYGSFANAIPHTDGLAVLGVFMTRANSPTIPNTVRPFMKFAEKVKEYQAESTMTSSLFSLRDLLKIWRFPVYTYPGSLTTPGCNEIVTWLVSTKTIYLTEAELALLKTIKDSHGHEILKSNRPVLPLGNRVVKLYP